MTPPRTRVQRAPRPKDNYTSQVTPALALNWLSFCSSTLEGESTEGTRRGGSRLVGIEWVTVSSSLPLLPYSLGWQREDIWTNEVRGIVCYTGIGIYRNEVILWLEVMGKLFLINYEFADRVQAFSRAHLQGVKEISCNLGVLLIQLFNIHTCVYKYIYIPYVFIINF